MRTNGLRIHPHSPEANRLLIRQPKPSERGGNGDHFLSVIAFDGNITMETVDSILRSQLKHRLWRGWKFHKGEGQARSRNECAHTFMTQSDCEYHDLCDADILTHPHHWLALRRHPEAKTSIICGAYPKKQEKIEFCFNGIKGGPEEPDQMQKMEVAKGGTGLMQIPRYAYDVMAKAYPERDFVCDYQKGPKGEHVIKHGWFCEDIRLDEDVGYVRHLTEDWMFCYWARKAGIKIYMDFSTTADPWVQHRGNTCYPLPAEIERGRLADELEIAKKRIESLEKQLNPPPAAP